MIHRTVLPRKHSHGGFTLVEVLVSILVLAVGLLGLASLQVTGLRNNLSAYQRGIATQLAYDIADRMRANPAAVASGAYNNQSAPEDAADCIANACSADEMAGYDLENWKSALGQLPGGSGVVCIDSTPSDGDAADEPDCDDTGSVYAIKIWWTDDRSKASNDATKTTKFTTSFRP